MPIDREGFFTPQITRAILDNLQEAVEHRIDGSIFFEGRTYQRMDRLASMFNEMALELTATILGKRHTELMTVKTPADWWEAVKERFLPDLLRVHYPVVYKEEVFSVKVYRACPHLKSAPTQLHVEFCIAKEGADKVKVSFEEYEAFMRWKKKGMPLFEKPKDYRWLEGKGRILIPYENPPIRARLAHFVRRNLLSPNSR